MTLLCSFKQASRLHLTNKFQQGDLIRVNAYQRSSTVR